jgi:hypothetical protein
MENKSHTRRLNNQEYYKTVSVKIGPELNERLIKAAAKQKLSMSEIIRASCVTALATAESIES